MELSDQLGRNIVIRSQPERIVSLVPSQTELLFELGLGSRVVGITKFCVHPKKARQHVTIIGGTKNIDIKRVLALNPDLIIANKEENELATITELQDHVPVWVSDVQDRNSAITMIESIGKLLSCEAAAKKMVLSIQGAFSTIVKREPESVLYLIWRKPWMAAGAGTFIDAMLAEMNLMNVVGDTRYPELNDDQIQQLNPKLVFLSSEPFPFADKHIAEVTNLLPDAKIMTVDGEMFSWYGSRMNLAPAYFNQLM